jgi:hypothetical protein
VRLKQLQDAVQRYLLAGTDLPGELEQAVEPPAGERWAIYQDGYRLRLVEALAGTYPALAQRMGTEAFDGLCARFITAYPSVHRSIRDYGAELGEFLAAGASTPEDAMRAELAAFEWQLAAAFDANDASPATATDIGAVPPEAWGELRFRPVPSLRRIATTTNAVAVWQALLQDSAVSAAGESASPVDMPVATRGAPAEWLVVRRALITEFRSLDSAEATALDEIIDGSTFAQVCELLLEQEDQPAAVRAASWLKGWLEGGLLLRAGSAV